MSNVILYSIFILNLVNVANVSVSFVGSIRLKVTTDAMSKLVDTLQANTVEWLSHMEMMWLLRTCRLAKRLVTTSPTYLDRSFYYQRNNMPPLPAHYDFDSDTSGKSD